MYEEQQPTRRRVMVVGAGSGLGSAIAEHLEGRGDAVVGADIGWPSQPRDGSLARVCVDVSDERSVEACVARAVELLGGLDVVVNCAGILGSIGPSHQISTREFDRVFAVNMRGAFLISRATIPHLLMSRPSRLIHLASLAGKIGNPQMSAYSASKAGLIGLVKSLGKEYAETGLTVNAIAPAAMDTAMMREMDPDRRARHRAVIPVGRFGAPSEAAALVEFVASEAAGFTTGFVFDLSGGRADY